MFLLFSVAGELLNVLLLRVLSILMISALGFTDDISDTPRGPQFVEFPVRYFYVPLKNKYESDIFGIIWISSLPHNIHTARSHFKTKLPVQKWSLKTTEVKRIIMQVLINQCQCLMLLTKSYFMQDVSFQINCREG